MDTCPTSHSKREGYMPKSTPQNKHTTKERGNKCGKVMDYKSKRWAWWGKPKGMVAGMDLRLRHNMDNRTK
jgi:hypothetical protein